MLTRLLPRRVEDDFSGNLILFDDLVGFRGVAERHDSMDDGVNFSSTRRVERFFDIGESGSSGAEDAQAAHVEALYIEVDSAAAMSAGCDQPK